MTSRGAGPKRWAALCLTLAVTVLATVATGHASAAVSCSFDPASGALALELTSGNALVLTRAQSTFKVDEMPLGSCAPGTDPATVQSANSLSVRDAVAGQGSQLTLDLGPADPALDFIPSVLADDGDDIVHLLDGVAEQVICGVGLDSVVADDPEVDTISSTCEQVNLAPGTTIVDGPPDGFASSQPLQTYGLSATEPASFELSVDAGGFGSCAQACTVGPLADGLHVLLFRAIDATALVERTPAWRTLVIDTYVRTAIRRAPAERSPHRRVLYKFRAEEQDPEDQTSFAEEAGATFTCNLDKRPYVPCTSPQRYRGLRRGLHTFRVIATDDAGNVDPDPAVDAFRVTRPKKHRR